MSIEVAKDDIKRLEKRIEKCKVDRDFMVSHLYETELYDYESKLTSLQKAYDNFKESIITNENLK